MITLDQALKLQVGDDVYEILRAENNLPRKWRITEVITDSYTGSQLILRVRQFLGDHDCGSTGQIRSERHLSQVCLLESDALAIIEKNEADTWKADHDRALQRHILYDRPQMKFLI